MESKSTSRFVYVDALRGIASLLVFFSHLMLFARTQLKFAAIIPAFLGLLCDYGVYGVQIFFVLSGFVIAHSLRNNSLNLKDTANFALRRQIRLDPPYWVVLTITILLQIVLYRIPSLKGDAPPSVAVALANYFYLHDILQWPRIVGLSWTLCLEIQFYVLFITLLAVGKKLSRAAEDSKPEKATIYLIFVTGLLSMLCSFLPFGYNWFLHYWFYFAIGVLAYWAFQHPSLVNFFYAFALAVVIGALVAGRFNFFDSKVPIIAQQTMPLPFSVGLLTALSLWYVGKIGKLETWGQNRIIQYFGKISYSLYLAHILAFSSIYKVLPKFLGGSLVSLLICTFTAITFGILAAHLLNLLVEKPSIVFSQKFRR